jgi:hypothetical protein
MLNTLRGIARWSLQTEFAARWIKCPKNLKKKPQFFIYKPIERFNLEPRFLT